VNENPTYRIANPDDAERIARLAFSAAAPASSMLQFLSHLKQILSERGLSFGIVATIGENIKSALLAEFSSHRRSAFLLNFIACGDESENISRDGLFTAAVDQCLTRRPDAEIFAFDHGGVLAKSEVWRRRIWCHRELRTLSRTSDSREYKIPTDFSIQPADLAAEEVWGLISESLDPEIDCFDKSAAEIRSWLEQMTSPFGSPMPLVVIDHSTNILAAVTLAYASEKVGWCEGIFVHPKYRRIGLAAALVRCSLNMFNAADISQAKANVDALRNPKAVRVFERIGFAVERAVPIVRIQ